MLTRLEKMQYHRFKEAFEEIVQLKQEGAPRAKIDSLDLWLHDLATRIDDEWAKTAAQNVLHFLERRQGEIPESLSAKVLAIRCIETLNQLFTIALDCKSLDEFAEALK